MNDVIQLTLENVYKLLETRKLEIFFYKCHILNTHKSKPNSTDELNNNDKLLFTTVFKKIEIIFFESSKWKNHINYIIPNYISIILKIL